MTEETRARWTFVPELAGKPVEKELAIEFIAGKVERHREMVPDWRPGSVVDLDDPPLVLVRESATGLLWRRPVDKIRRPSKIVVAEILWELRSVARRGGDVLALAARLEAVWNSEWGNRPENEH